MLMQLTVFLIKKKKRERRYAYVGNVERRSNQRIVQQTLKCETTGARKRNFSREVKRADDNYTIIPMTRSSSLPK